uniref:Vacuolar ATPase assembly protein VMA22 n=1 Tax=Polytomella parva TaxID=51329 RepID=A0A7S0VIH5_9CHLO|mmetsp:Transcript_33945/g.61276  ORF Transcript_33945/g.61276 Transcript_33945/m.61276 type:complete len:187 (+) Transcript_33945:172-732(+)
MELDTKVASNDDVKDLLFSKSLDCVEEYITCQQRLSKKLKQGLFNLSKAKYSLGTLGQVNYNSNASALITTKVKNGIEGQEVVNEDICASVCSQFSLIQLDDDAAKKENPLHWFSVLPPSSLREAQKDFLEVVNLCLDLANASQQIRFAMDSWENKRLTEQEPVAVPPKNVDLQEEMKEGNEEEKE